MPQDSRAEMPGSPSEERSYNGQLSATVKWMCNWEDRYYVRGLLCDPPGTVYPYRPDFGCYIQTVSVEPFPGEVGVFDPATGLSTYKKAMITARYGTNVSSHGTPNPENPQEVISETFEPSVEFLTIDPRWVKWSTPYWAVKSYDAATGAPSEWWQVNKVEADQAPGYQMHGAIYTYIRHNVAAFKPEYDALVGTTNQYAVKCKTFNRTFAAETLLYLPSALDVSWFGQGANLVSARARVAMKFHWRNIPSWNKFWRPDLWDGSNASSMWDTMKILVASPSTYRVLEMYPKADWAALFS